MVQLPGYLERVLAGGRDLALVLLPLLNDLRAVRGSALLSEGTLLLLNLKSDRQAQPTSPAPGEPPLTVAQWARRLRSRFQTGLIGWIRGERAEQNLEILATVATRLEQVATEQSVFQLWWVVGALIEALRENGRREQHLASSGCWAWPIARSKRLYEQGETRYAQHPPVELLNNLLYYVARSASAGPRVLAVRSLVPPERTAAGRRSDRAGARKSVRALGQAHADRGRGDPRGPDARSRTYWTSSCAAAAGSRGARPAGGACCARSATRSACWALGELRARVQEATAAARGHGRRARERADEAHVVQVAASLIEVEDHLDEQLVGLILPRKQAPSDTTARIASDQDFQQVQSAVLRECVVNLARVKEIHRAERQRHARRRWLRQLAGADARHQGRAADARQVARGRDCRRDNRSTCGA